MYLYNTSQYFNVFVFVAEFRCDISYRGKFKTTFQFCIHQTKELERENLIKCCALVTRNAAELNMSRGKL